MASCPNCGTSLGCGCQKRTLSNGAQGCVNCAGKDPVSTPVAKTSTSVVRKTSAPISPEGKSPTPLNVWGKDRYITLQKFTK